MVFLNVGIRDQAQEYRVILKGDVITSGGNDTDDTCQIQDETSPGSSPLFTLSRCLRCHAALKAKNEKGGRRENLGSLVSADISMIKTDSPIIQMPGFDIKAPALFPMTNIEGQMLSRSSLVNTPSNFGGPIPSSEETRNGMEDGTDLRPCTVVCQTACRDAA